MAVLANDPFWLTPDQIARLTPRQVQDLYFCDRDKNGMPVIGSRESITLQEAHRLHWERLGAPRWRADKEWRQWNGEG